MTRHRHSDPIGSGVVGSCFQHTTDKIGPSFPKGFPVGGIGVGGARGLLVSRISSSSPGVHPVVQDRMLVRLGDVDEHAGEELQRVEELGLFVFGSGLIENAVAVLVEMAPLEGDGAANDIAAESFESLGVGGVEVDIIIDAKAAPAPGTEELDPFIRERVVFL